MTGRDPDDDRRTLRAILDHCATRCQAAGRPGEDPALTAATQARKWAYARVARAAGELLEEMEG